MYLVMYDVSSICYKASLTICFVVFLESQTAVGTPQLSGSLVTESDNQKSPADRCIHSSCDSGSAACSGMFTCLAA